jgi:hypothetical protein
MSSQHWIDAGYHDAMDGSLFLRSPTGAESIPQNQISDPWRYYHIGFKAGMMEKYISRLPKEVKINESR